VIEIRLSRMIRRRCSRTEGFKAVPPLESDINLSSTTLPLWFVLGGQCEFIQYTMSPIPPAQKRQAQSTWRIRAAGEPIYEEPKGRLSTAFRRVEISATASA